MAKLNVKATQKLLVDAGVIDNAVNAEVAKTFAENGFLVYKLDLTGTPEQLAVMPELPNGNSPNSEDRLIVLPQLDESGDNTIGATILYSKERGGRDPKIDLNLFSTKPFSIIGKATLKLTTVEVDGVEILTGEFEDSK